tara:strand:+ start:3088 stop:3966 length:879 start_codon:yes stop_codon:yes gene_type:complete
MKKRFKLFFFGFGQVAKYFLNKLIQEKYNFDLITTNTRKTENKIFNQINFKSYYFFNNKFDPNLLNELNNSNKILISIPPTEGHDIVLKTFHKAFKESKFDWITYLSATSIYGNTNGEWVDENTNPNPTSFRGISRLNAEKAWLEYFKNYKIPLQIFRLAGIYSNENNVLQRLKLGTQNIIEKKNHYFSRIHVEDIAEILFVSLQKFSSGEIFNISDDYPSSNAELVKYAASLINIKIPKSISVDQVESEMLKDFYKDSKRVKNQKMKNFFGHNLKYPTFKEGLKFIKNHMI